MLRQGTLIENLQARADEEPIRIIVIDYQNCAFSPLNTDSSTSPHFLSPELMTFIRNQHYDAFVGHTMRCIFNIEYLEKIGKEKVPASEQARYLANFTTRSITQNIAIETGIQNLGEHQPVVMTLDDLVADVPGDSYQDLVVYEEQHQVTQHKHIDNMEQQFDFMSHKNNEMLRLIANKITSLLPGKNIQLDIVDDSLPNCRLAFDATSQKDWPQNVTIEKIYRFNPTQVSRQVKEMTHDDLVMAQRRRCTTTRKKRDTSAIPANSTINSSVSTHYATTFSQSQRRSVRIAEQNKKSDAGLQYTDTKRRIA